MEIRQIRLNRMAIFCYMVGDEATGTCALIDPAFDTKRILAETSRRGFRPTHVINTHGHSDHTAGNAAVLEATHARLFIHEKDAPRLKGRLNRVLSRVMGGKGSPPPHVLLKDGDRIRVGETELTVLHTPGHTPGSICIYAPGHLFTGDTLFVSAVGRTDLRGGSLEVLLRSIREKIYTLPGDTVVWPGHDYGPEPKSTVAAEMSTNPFTRPAKRGGA
ncbi:MAG: MBL fold metallo-hydrolase [Deltaproteobacteria bacterium]|nr:MBL fold metallo-hydrolase [Deltaproteobacteria bacterium]MBW1923505.1 MBL fold metallo-hydrolase [Deltaproteobacteria bacterium]MBW1949884.1 MBL fold metallo-hydrolase [Deltaproteobacteria bacterium]MBW2008470.1 MBL fold metallo-hydrolase [Deltaproteobacteria bacterium]MBW2101379.1 MBL fold metallo-hydrolase [Deltaproteobacteria bacterium]